MDHRGWMSRAVELAHRSPPSATAFSVGAVIVDNCGRKIADGFSRDRGPRVHAEESALLNVDSAAGLQTATMYSTLEPCSTRTSRPRSTCTHLIIAAGIARVVFAWREPDLFVRCDGMALLIAAGIEVIHLPEFADHARAPNTHLNIG